MDAVEWSTSIYALAAAMARCMSPEELSRASLLLTQLGTTLGTTLGTIAALRELEETGEDVEEVSKKSGQMPALF